VKKILHIAWREFLATVLTKAFLIGVLVLPVIIGVMVIVLPILINEEAPKIDGEVALVDPSGAVTATVAEYLSPEGFVERRREIEETIDEVMPDAVKEMTAANPAASKMMEQQLDQALGDVPTIQVTELSTGADLEAEKQALLTGDIQSGGRLAVVVLHDNAVRVIDGQEGYGTYDLYIREKLDDRITDAIRDALRGAIVEARISGEGLDPVSIQAMTQVARVRPKEVSAKGEREANELINMLLPMGFMALLLVSVMTAGQQLMTTTIEEKSSRVVEVLLSAVSPIQLMTGKILGQLGVGFLMLSLYSALGIATLVSFALMGLVDPWLFFYLMIFFLIAYLVVASLMAAIGAAVNDIREAQSLLTPVMLIIMVPWLLWMPITRDPNSLFATITSLLPPINSFVMMLRLTSTTPPPGWQVWLSIAIGALSVYAAIWLSAKVFRVGLLMYGKPPNLKTLVRWVRMA
jgi:ABC-2 type transport system permease protein